MFRKKKRWKKYHEGYLFRDRIINREVDDVARQMYRLAEKGHGTSIQWMVHDGEPIKFDYNG